jgi:hypothetical protein
MGKSYFDDAIDAQTPDALDAIYHYGSYATLDTITYQS